MRTLVRIERLARPLMQAYARLVRGMTLGCRGAVVDAQGRVLLIEHTYVDGWYLPGGGVERGENVYEALAREMAEEAGVRLTAPARLVQVYDNGKHFRGDHVLIWRVDHWAPCEPSAQGEVARIGWFPPNDLPEGTTAATRLQVAAALG